MAIQVQASVNAGAYAAGKVTVVASDAVQFRLHPQTIAEVSSVRWEIYEAPTGYTTPAGWTADANGLSWYYVATAATALMPPSITLGALWGKYLIRATANAGVLGGVVTTDAVDETCCLVMLSPESVENLAALEENQSDPRGPLAIVKKAIEVLEPFAPPAGAGAGDIAVADGAGGWDAYEPATLIRTAYDSRIVDIDLAHDAGEGWLDLWALVRNTILPVDETAIEIDVKFTVKDNHGALANTKDVVSIRGVYRRHDFHNDMAENIDDGTVSLAASPTIGWILTLPAASSAGGGPLFETRITRSVANVLIQARLHATSDRRVTAELYLGNPA